MRFIRIVLVFVSVTTLLSLFYLNRIQFVAITSTDLKTNKSKIVYSIVIDAGSTGSRIHVFKLSHLHQPGFSFFFYFTY
jgi:hypothetical protein